MENQPILKEISNILDRVNDEEKEKILNLSRRVLDESMCHDALIIDKELREKSRKEFENLKMQGKMSVNAGDFEKSVIMMSLFATKMDFSKKFRMVLDYDPELLSAMIEYYWD